MSGSVDLGGRRIIKKIFFKQKTAYEIVTGDWSSDVCSSDLIHVRSSSVAAAPDRCRSCERPPIDPKRSEERRVGKECER